MKSSISFYLRYILFFLAVQMLFNIVFLILYWNLAAGEGFFDRILSLVYGLKLDVSLTGYVLGFPTLVLILYNIFRTDLFKKIIDVYTFIIILLLVPAYFTNLVIYKYWKYPIDQSIFDYLSTPGEMLASLTFFQLIFTIALLALSIYLLYFQVYLRWLSKILRRDWKGSWIAAFLFLLMLPALVLPIRGGLASSPIQTGSVYFHSNTFLNHAAINPVWNLVYSLIEGERLTGTVSYYDEEVVMEMMEDLYIDNNVRSPMLNTDSPNIILILLESFAQPIVTNLGGDGTAAPNFNALINEGIFFSKMYASGTMTDRALGALLSGYPSLPGSCIMHYESKAQVRPKLNMKLKSAGYNSAFLYGGDIDFAHMRSFLILHGFENIIDDKDFSKDILRTNWGVPDHVVFDRLFEISDQASQPFFHAFLTLSSHFPFDVPMETVIPGSDDLSKYKNSVYYTDSCLGEFIRKAKTRDWWDSTLIILTADHGCRIGDIMAYEDRRFNIPMIWIGGALEVRDTVITKFVSQTDFPGTLLNQLNLSWDEFIFSKDMLSDSSKSFAYYTYNDGIGFVNDSATSIYNLTTGKYILKEGAGFEGDEDPGLAYLQWLLNEFNSR